MEKSSTIEIEMNLYLSFFRLQWSFLFLAIKDSAFKSLVLYDYIIQKCFIMFKALCIFIYVQYVETVTVPNKTYYSIARHILFLIANFL